MSETDKTAGALFREGRLADAVAAANAAVRVAPGDLGARMTLADLLLFTGNLERADVILDAAAQVDPQAAVVVAEYRQLVRADMARRQLRRDGRVPEFLDGATPAMTALLAAHVAWRAGDAETAAKHADEAEGLRPRVAGDAAGTPFADLRDGCDLHVGIVEVLTTTGKYFWIPTERIASIEFHAPKRPRDLFWRRATMSVIAGPDGEVYIPALYGAEHPTEAQALGRETDWIEGAGGLTVGVGQRMWLLDDELSPMLDLTDLEMIAAPYEPPPE